MKDWFEKYRNKISILLFIIGIGTFIYTNQNYIKGLFQNQETVKIQQTAKKVSNNKKTKEKSQPEKTPLELYKNISELQKTFNNPEIFGWITVSGTNIDEPLVHKPNDNEFYLNHEINLEPNYLGSLFLDAKGNKALTDKVNYIFGHNTDLNNKFSELENVHNPEKSKEINEFKIYLDDKVLKYEVVGHLLTPPLTDLYPEERFNENDTEYLMNLLKEYPNVQINKINKNDTLVFLVTCKDFNDSTERTIVIGRLKETMNIVK